MAPSFPSPSFPSPSFPFPTNEPTPPPKDYLRTPPGRWAGYAYVVGRVMPSQLMPTIGKRAMLTTTAAYVALDAAHKATDERGLNIYLKRVLGDHVWNGLVRVHMTMKAMDAVFWQSLASFVVPWVITEGLARSSTMTTQRFKVPRPMSRYIRVGVVVLLTPVIGTVIDEAVGDLLDNTTRPNMML